MTDFGIAQDIAGEIGSKLEAWRRVDRCAYDGSDLVIESKRRALWRNGFQYLDPAHTGPDLAPPPKDFRPF